MMLYPLQSQRWPSLWLAILVLLLIVLLGLTFFLTMPSEAMIASPELGQLLALFGQSFPFIGVTLLGGIVGLTEILSSFPTYPSQALSTRWAWILILVNALAAWFAFYVARLSAPADVDMLMLMVSVGVGFQVIIRTRFTFAKEIGEKGREISLDVGWLYDQFQNLCKTQIDLELMNSRRTAVSQLLARFRTLPELYDIAYYTIRARSTLSPETEKALLAELDKLIDPKAPTSFAQTSIALLILENGGQAYVNLLLSQTQAGPPPPETLVKQLRDSCTLSDMVKLAEQTLTNAPTQLEWVRQAAAPTPDVSETSQKATIAHFLVQQVGREKIETYLKEKGKG
jgi:hypothetical protein